MFLNAIRENEIMAKISEITVFYCIYDHHEDGVKSCEKTILFTKTFRHAQVLIIEMKYCKFANFCESLILKIKPSQIGDITLLFTDMGKSCPVCIFLRRKCVF